MPSYTHKFFSVTTQNNNLACGGTLFSCYIYWSHTVLAKVRK
jgi:hypothetical protein